ncbi:hypothetical protein WICMUC_000088 [Wickerhamomyces mucosus]|uniref:Uncharacterized protein n=1 Tax=Wickerhamomyces mucosus TaxID=1378264 RepID=A0A9P8TJG7_9ASCO|nr:hypothetical protein WICMUC_000088 [Wickerhamomyces mucosus]
MNLDNIIIKGDEISNNEDLSFHVSNAKSTVEINLLKIEDFIKSFEFKSSLSKSVILKASMESEDVKFLGS